MSVKEYQVDIYTGVKHWVKIRKKFKQKNKDIDCIIHCKEDNEVDFPSKGTLWK